MTVRRITAPRDVLAAVRACTLASLHVCVALHPALFLAYAAVLWSCCLSCCLWSEPQLLHVECGSVVACVVCFTCCMWSVLQFLPVECAEVVACRVCRSVGSSEVSAADFASHSHCYSHSMGDTGQTYNTSVTLNHTLAQQYNLFILTGDFTCVGWRLVDMAAR